MKNIIISILFIPFILFAETTCDIDIDNINFGTYDIYATSNINEISEITISCIDDSRSSRWRYGSRFNNVDITVYPYGGNSSNDNDRFMSNNIDSLRYNLYTDSNYENIWSENNPITDTLRLRNGSVEETYNYYGTIFSNQMVSPGSYNDTLTVIVEY